MKIIADDKIPYLKGILEPYADITYLPVKEFTRKNIQDAEILIIRTPNKCTQELLTGSRVKYIASTTIGFDHIDTEFCAEAGIKWINCPGCNSVSVGQYMLASLIELARKEKFNLHDQTFGIVGVGNVGKEVEKIYKILGFNYLLCDPPRAVQEGPDSFKSLEEISEVCNIISFHVPFAEKNQFPTRHLANQKFFESLKKQPYFINVARGGVHDTHALIHAKKEQLIKGMIIDCWENEPRISTELLDLTTIATPHIAGFSADGKANGTRMCLEAIAKEFDIPLENALKQISPALPIHPVIDLNEFPDNRIESAVLKTFSPMCEDSKLRKFPEQFEYQRTHYDNPREFHAYTIVNTTDSERKILQKLGFN